jgi:hypothetical protein
MKIIAQERKTSLTPIQIVSKLRRDTLQEFSSDLLNEIGVIFHTAQEGADKALAESVLIEALDIEDPELRFIAYCQLRRANGTASDTVHQTLEKFRADAANKDIVEKAAKKLWL